MTSTPCILLTGFEPFGGEPVNPSWEVARALAGERVGSLQVESVQLPCAFALAPQALQDALTRFSPRAVLCLGQAEGRSEVTPERVAINILQARDVIVRMHQSHRSRKKQPEVASDWPQCRVARVGGLASSLVHGY